MMINQDHFLLSKTGSIFDGWSTARSSSAVKQDSTINCVNNDQVISWGKSTTSGSLYQYWHTSRLFVTGDSANCDDDITTSTQLCTVYQEGNTVTDLSGSHSSVFCGAIKNSKFDGLLKAAMLVGLAGLL